MNGRQASVRCCFYDYNCISLIRYLFSVYYKFQLEIFCTDHEIKVGKTNKFECIFNIIIISDIVKQFTFYTN